MLTWKLGHWSVAANGSTLSLLKFGNCWTVGIGFDSTDSYVIVIPCIKQSLKKMYHLHCLQRKLLKYPCCLRRPVSAALLVVVEKLLFYIYSSCVIFLKRSGVLQQLFGSWSRGARRKSRGNFEALRSNMELIILFSLRALVQIQPFHRKGNLEPQFYFVVVLFQQFYKGLREDEEVQFYSPNWILSQNFFCLNSEGFLLSLVGEGLLWSYRNLLIYWLRTSMLWVLFFNFWLIKLNWGIFKWKA